MIVCLGLLSLLRLWKMCKEVEKEENINVPGCSYGMEGWVVVGRWGEGVVWLNDRTRWLRQPTSLMRWNKARSIQTPLGTFN